MSWFRTGKDAATPQEEQLGGSGSGRKFPPRRFWMPAGSKTELTFLDDDTVPLEVVIEGKEHSLEYPIIIDEHQLLLNGHRRNWFTCTTRGGTRDRFCEADDRPREKAVFTVIDHGEWTDKNGNVHKDEKKLYVIPTISDAYDDLLELSEDNGGLRGLRVRVKRGKTPTSTNVGTSFSVKKRYTLPDDNELYQVFDYFDVLKPPTDGEAAKIVGAVVSEEAAPIPF